MTTFFFFFSLFVFDGTQKSTRVDNEPGRKINTVIEQKKIPIYYLPLYTKFRTLTIEIIQNSNAHIPLFSTEHKTGEL